MTKIKFCGLSHFCDIQAANTLQPEYIGFVFYPPSFRSISFQRAEKLKKYLSPHIQTVGVFVNEEPEIIARFLEEDIIDIAQLHGSEDNAYVKKLQRLTRKPLIQAYRVSSYDQILAAQNSFADYILLDSGAGTGTTFDWELLSTINRPYFLAGGLHPGNVETVIRRFHPYGIDVSSGIETTKRKDKNKMAAFIQNARKEEIYE